MSLNRKLFSKSASDAVCNSESLEPFGNEASYNKNVAIYQFEESSGTTLTDSSGNGNNATISGMTWSSDAAFGSYSGSFDGTNDYVELPSNILPENSTSSSTATCWFKTTYAGTEMGTILNSYNAYAGGTSSTPGWTIFTEGSANFLRLGSYYLDGSNVVGTDGTTNVSDGNWHFIAVVFDISANTLKCYLDGNSSPEISITGLTTSTVDIFTGNATIGYQKNPVGSNRYFNGQIDQVRIYSKALNTEEISTLYLDETTSTASSTTIIPGTSCVAYYPLDYDASDKSTNYDGTPSNVEFVQNGKINYSALFNGSSSHITLPNSVEQPMITAQKFGVSMWFKIDALPTGSDKDYLISLYQEGYLDIRIEANGVIQGQVAEETSGTNRAATSSSGVISANTWHHVVFTGQTNNLVLYVDNSSVATQSTWNGTFFHSTAGCSIGSRNNGTDYFFPGKIDEVRIFNTALSASNVTTLYGLTACTQTCTTDNQDFIATNTAYYKLDGDATDYHSGTYDATATNITYASGRFGSSAEFNGSSSILDTTVSVPTNWTLSLWLKRDPSGYFGGTTNASVRSGVYFYSNPNGSIAVYNRDGSGGNIDTFYSSTGLVNQNQWHHIAMSFDSTSGTGLTTIYLDGSSIGSVDGTPSHSTAFKFGRSGDYASDYFDGYIDQIRIFSSALTDTNIQDLYDTEFQCYITKDATNPFADSSEKGFYKFEENTGTTLTDSSGNGNNGTISNMTWSSTDPCFGSYSGSFNGTATSSRSKVVTSGLTTYNNFSISFWFKSDDVSATRIIMGTSDDYSSQTGFGVFTGVSSGQLRWRVSDGSSTVDLDYSTISTGRWYHVAITQNSSTNDKILYLNGSSVATSTSSINATNQGYSLLIGGYSGSNNTPYDGDLDQIRVFNRVLTGEEVWKLYAERNN